jgi:hypothetical protein
MKYDPLVAPDPKRWLEMDEHLRLALVREYHERAGFDHPNQVLHAAMHTIVENQLAMGEVEPRKTLERLMAAGIDRHEAVHAILDVVARHVYFAMKGEITDEAVMKRRYNRELRKLTVEEWLKRR